MKILFFSDLHQNSTAISQILEQLKRVDVGFGLGDYATFGKGLLETVEQLDTGLDLYLLPGNHDDAEELNEICKDLSNLHYFHADFVTLGKITFAGLGGGLPGLPFGLSDDQARQILREFHHLQNLILCTHTPPYGTEIDKAWSGTHIGYLSLREFVNQKQPIAVYCGHVHEQAGHIEYLGSTKLVGVGTKGLVIDI